jgi:hypothetical protein
MSLINSVRDMSRIGLKEGTRYRAQVIKNDDPKQLGRIKFKIPEFFNFPVKDAPWAIPQNNGADGATNKAGTVNIPRVGSFVDIMFMGGSVYHPAYHATSIFKTVYLKESKVNYPNRKIHKLQNGTSIIIDEKANSMEIYVPGDIGIKSKASTSIVVGGKCNLYANDEISVTSTKGDINVKAEEGNINVTCTKGTTAITSGGNLSVRSTNGKIQLMGSGEGKNPKLGGIVTGMHNCMVTGKPHNACSLDVFST